MSNSISEVTVALNQILSTASGIANIHFADTQDPSNPSSDEEFVTAYNMPSDSDSPTLSGTGYEQDTGIYQATVFKPRGWGALKADQLADAIKAVYGRDLLIDMDNGGKLRIRKVVIMRGDYTNENQYMVPVRVYWAVVG